jgi:glucose/arabinose dehydrogenase
MRPPRLVAVVCALALVVAACGDDGTSDDPGLPEATPTTAAPPDTTAAPDDEGSRQLEMSELATGLEAPWDVAFTPDGRAWVTERDTGVLLMVDADGSTSEVRTFAVDPTSEGGLMGLAVSPDFTDDGWLYAYYTGSDDNRIVRFQEGGPEQPVLAGIPKARNHNGGRIAFGPDGMLYAGTGDALQTDLAQDRNSLAGKVLRMDRDGGVPVGNPFDGSLVWSLGHRNVQGLAWDEQERLYVTELGPEVDDEVNRIEPGGNYGWPEVTGVAGRSEFVDPIAVFAPAEASPSGGVVPTGPEAGAWEGHLVFANLRGQRLWLLELDADGSVTSQQALFVNELGRLRHVAQAPDGSLWVLTNNRDGRGTPGPDDDRILRLLPPR